MSKFYKSKLTIHGYKSNSAGRLSSFFFSKKDFLHKGILIEFPRHCDAAFQTKDKYPDTKLAKEDIKFHFFQHLFCNIQTKKKKKKTSCGWREQKNKYIKI